MRKVLLAFPYFYTGIVKDQLFPPLGISLLSAILKQYGIDVMKLDCTFMTKTEALEKATAYQPDITGIYVMTTLTSHAIELLDILKKSIPNSIFVTGGPLPTLYPLKFAEKFDYVFRGEATVSFPDFCRDYLNVPDKFYFLQNLSPSAYPGLFSSKRGGVDSPAIHLTKQTIDECPIFGSLVRFRSLEGIIAEIRNIISYGYDSLWIADDLFTYSDDFLNSFCERLIEENLTIPWSCLSRVDSINDKITAVMQKSGCYKVYLGIESGNDSVLKLMNKKTNVDQIKAGIKIFNNNGIKCAGFFLVGYPGETVDTIEETFSFALSLDLDEISFNVPYPLPGSKLFEHVFGVRDNDWMIENETKFLYDSEFDEVWLKRRILETCQKHTGCPDHSVH